MSIVVVEGSASASGEPHSLDLGLRVLIEASTASQAMDASNVMVEALRAKFEPISNVSMEVSSPRERSYLSGRGDWLVSAEVSVRVRARGLAGMRSVESALNYLDYGVTVTSFEVTSADDAGLWDEARRRAVQDGLAGAASYASALGFEEARVAEVREIVDEPEPTAAVVSIPELVNRTVRVRLTCELY